MKSEKELNFNGKLAVENTVDSVNNFLQTVFRYGYGEPGDLRRKTIRPAGPGCGIVGCHKLMPSAV